MGGVGLVKGAKALIDNPQVLKGLGNFLKRPRQNTGNNEGLINRFIKDESGSVNVPFVIGLGINPKSVKQFGHTFTTHGSGLKNTQSLIDRARGKGKPQGQFLNNQAAANFLSQHSNITKPIIVDLPSGLGQVIRPNGTIVSASRVQLVPKTGGGFRTAFPIE